MDTDGFCGPLPVFVLWLSDCCCIALAELDWAWNPQALREWELRVEVGSRCPAAIATPARVPHRGQVEKVVTSLCIASHKDASWGESSNEATER